jgi:hypothetical protein
MRQLGIICPIDGNPNVIVANMLGAATLLAVRYLDATAPVDGTVITMFDPGLITESIAMPEAGLDRRTQDQPAGALLAQAPGRHAGRRGSRNQ